MLTARHRSIAAVVLFLTSVTVTASSPAPWAQGAGGRRAEILVAVLGKNEQPVEGLTNKDFIVREDNISREIVSVRPGMGPSHIVFLVDDSQANINQTSFLRDSVKAFLTNVAAHKPAPQVRLTTFGDRPTMRQEFTSALPVLTKAADRLVPLLGAGSQLLAAISEACRDLKKQHIAGAAIVILLNEASQEFSDESHARIEEDLQSSGAALWAVVQQNAASRGETTQGRERAIVLGDVTRASGGMRETVLNVQGLVPGLELVGTALMSQYAITYGQADRLVPASRRSVETTDRSLTVVVRRWVTP